MPVQANRSLGKKSDAVQFSIPQLTNFRNPLRTVTVADANAAAVPADSYLHGEESRWGVGNVIEVLVNGAAAGVVIDLYAVEDGVFYKRGTHTTTAAQESFRFADLPAMVFALMVTNPGASVTIAAGITR